jgi:large subunit ribosomal protein L21
MYAVIELQWHQYIVTKWDNIIVDRMEWKKWDKINIENVLSIFDQKWETVSVGFPYIKNAKVSVEIVDHKKWDKINVLKFKRKNRYKRRIWFRPYETILEVKKIELNG